ncbi:MAG: hypothetical protein M3Q07_13675 [Pseudobdellovibrionaceae bacterium]|nr:hypothetical protein [Pseudobdellovibrionaceae bacterium]
MVDSRKKSLATAAERLALLPTQAALSPRAQKFASYAVTGAAVLLPTLAFAAGTTEGATAFQSALTFISDAASGTLGKTIAITGGVIGLGTGAATGRALPAAAGIILAIFGAQGPKIIDTIFGTAII